MLRFAEQDLLAHFIVVLKYCIDIGIFTINLHLFSINMGVSPGLHFIETKRGKAHYITKEKGPQPPDRDAIFRSTQRSMGFFRRKSSKLFPHVRGIGGIDGRLVELLMYCLSLVGVYIGVHDQLGV